MQRYTITASDQKTQATVVPERGGWVSSIIFPFASGAREILYQHPYAWDPVIKDLLGGAPFLFPVCARISRNNQEGMYLFDGKQYHLKIHGFSWYQAWQVAQADDQSIEMVLKDSAETLQRYPFKFEVRLKYRIAPGKIYCDLTVTNQEYSRAMPYYAGFHPYLFIPGDKSKTFLEFKAVRRLKYNETLTDIIGDQPILKTPIALSDPSINEQLSMLSRDKKVQLTYENGEKIVVTVEEGSDCFPYLQLYHMSEKPFFCIEHWMGFPNAINTVSGVRWLQPSESEHAVYTISVPCLPGMP
ncbi:MAG: hypothetical protein A3E84_04225 [Gammaproteobacteria bacterium RIFCSPHIGHO2_12_FULL_42_13]|nr:MAG: hypothetical protein A3E84_04225 [Gammaproteobacteria bacterium RIFCSPHIGHO2_12_FULL_42_13]